MPKNMIGLTDEEFSLLIDALSDAMERITNELEAGENYGVYDEESIASFNAKHDEYDALQGELMRRWKKEGHGR